MLFLNEISNHTTANFTINCKKHSVIGFQTKNIEYLYKHLKELKVNVEEEIIDEGEDYLNPRRRI